MARAAHSSLAILHHFGRLGRSAAPLSIVRPPARRRRRRDRLRAQLIQFEPAEAAKSGALWLRWPAKRILSTHTLLARPHC